MFVTKAFAKGSFEEVLRVSKVFQVLNGLRGNRADKLGEFVLTHLGSFPGLNGVVLTTADAEDGPRLFRGRLCGRIDHHVQVTVTGSQKSQESVNLDVPLPRCHLCGCLTTVSPTAQPLPPSPVGVTLAGPPLKATKLLADAKMLRWQSLAGEPKSYNFSMLLAWHSRGQEFNSLRLHQIGNQNPRSLKNGRGFFACCGMLTFPPKSMPLKS